MSQYPNLFILKSRSGMRLRRAAPCSARYFSSSLDLMLPCRVPMVGARTLDICERRARKMTSLIIEVDLGSLEQLVQPAALERIGSAGSSGVRQLVARYIALRPDLAHRADLRLQPTSSTIDSSADERTYANRTLTTLLFTDIVDATQTASALGDRRWHELLDRHHAILRREVARYRGCEVDNAGDGFFVMFDGAARAVDCACKISAEVATIGLAVRAGLHTGECEMLASKPAGIAVHIAARIMSQAGASEVLVSSTVKEVVAGSDLVFEDRGTAALKGVNGEWRLFRVQRN